MFTAPAGFTGNSENFAGAETPERLWPFFGFMANASESANVPSYVNNTSESPVHFHARGI